MKFSRLHPRIKNNSITLGDILVLIIILFLAVSSGAIILSLLPH